MCIKGNHLVQTQKGLLRMIDEIGNMNGEQYQRLSGLEMFIDDTSRKSTVRHFFVRGYGPTVRITTRDGVELEVSENHRFRVIDAEGNYISKTALSLGLGDELVCMIGDCPVFLPSLEFDIDDDIALPTHMNSSFIYLIGVLLAYGQISDDQVILTFPTNAEFKQSKVFIILNDWKNDEIEDFSDLDIQVGTSGITIKSTSFLNLVKRYHITSKLPFWLRTSSRDIVTQFFSGLMIMKTDITIPNSILAQDLIALARTVGIYIQCKRHVDGNFYVSHIIDKVVDRIWHGFYKDNVTHISVGHQCNTYDLELISDADWSHYRTSGVLSICPSTP